ncbi:MAG: P-II family nitrogen regulator [Clostridiaceae bacterium]|nr:P-II family nitrogen regulator [Clostridiaceae bacterium]
MYNTPYKKSLEVLYIIVNFGLGSKIIKTAKQSGILGATIFLGKGTVKSHLLEILGLSDIRKEIVLMVSERTTAYKALEKLNSEFNLDKPHHGIAFSTTVADLFGARSYEHNSIEENKESRGVENSMYKVICIIVDRGKAEDVMEAATNAGARGGTIINARGSGIHETNTLFSMPIEPEKEIVMILSKNDLADSIISSIRQKLRIDEPGNGIIFVQDVNKTYGLR